MGTEIYINILKFYENWYVVRNPFGNEPEQKNLFFQGLHRQPSSVQASHADEIPRFLFAISFCY